LDLAPIFPLTDPFRDVRISIFAYRVVLPHSARAGRLCLVLALVSLAGPCRAVWRWKFCGIPGREVGDGRTFQIPSPVTQGAASRGERAAFISRSLLRC